ncbi:ribonuclease HII [Candidatus Epulonipiscioides gigas]|nr:ribonuclease HII [Epulopiscium sp. SCG-C07WGA-EpuloA2]
MSNKEERAMLEKERLDAMMQFDEDLSKNKGIIVGVDEAGRGSLAGDVVAAAVILPTDCSIIGLNDSKKLSEKKRETLYEQILEQALSIGIGKVSAKNIDKINILQATLLAMRKAVYNIHIPFELPIGLVIVDGDKSIPINLPQQTIVKGDAKSASIAAASIIAKVTRDRSMRKLDELHPEYGFAKHKGYATKEHYEAIKKFGIIDAHRKTFLKGIQYENN